MGAPSTLVFWDMSRPYDSISFPLFGDWKFAWRCDAPDLWLGVLLYAGPRMLRACGHSSEVLRKHGGGAQPLSFQAPAVRCLSLAQCSTACYSGRTTHTHFERKRFTLITWPILTMERATQHEITWGAVAMQVAREITRIHFTLSSKSAAVPSARRKHARCTRHSPKRASR